MSRRAYMIIAAVVIIILGWKGKQIMNRAEFKKKFLEAAKNVDLKGFNPYVLLAHASLESGDGSGFAGKENNIFSLQAPASWKGRTITQGGTGNKFRTYASYEAAIVDFINLIIGWPSNYGPAASAAIKGDIVAYAKGLKYAPKPFDSTSKTYVEDLISRYKSISA